MSGSAALFPDTGCSVFALSLLSAFREPAALAGGSSTPALKAGVHRVSRWVFSLEARGKVVARLRCSCLVLEVTVCLFAEGGLWSTKRLHFLDCWFLEVTSV